MTPAATRARRPAGALIESMPLNRPAMLGAVTPSCTADDSPAGALMPATAPLSIAEICASNELRSNGVSLIAMPPSR
jgi:hypothetical protein